MNIDNASGYTLTNLSRINILLGKNGCGKSLLLRRVEQGLRNRNGYGLVSYISPERGGRLIYETGIEQNIIAKKDWLSEVRRHNQSAQFRQQSVSQFKELEMLVLREIEKGKRNDLDYTFDLYVAKVNALLDNIEIRRSDISFKIFKKNTDIEIQSDAISSGESELISLAIECLVFSKKCKEDKHNILFIDEPDVHLHSDLQRKLIYFLIDLVDTGNFAIVIATHSTSILRATVFYEYAYLSFMAFDQKEIKFKPISDIYTKILPILGAHPLSNVINEVPVLLVDGEDDARIWQQAVRSSNGRICLYPCSVNGTSEMHDFEKETKYILDSVYDSAKAYSLRDKDSSIGNIDDFPPIIRMKLHCRNSENLLLTNEVLNNLNTTWHQLTGGINNWIKANDQHPHYNIMKAFYDSGLDRMNYDIKDIRNDIMGIIGSSKPWEVAVGQTIAELEWDDSTQFDRDGSICNFLGEKTVKNLLPKKNQS